MAEVKGKLNHQSLKWKILISIIMVEVKKVLKDINM
jgi:hypothetical protein